MGDDKKNSIRLHRGAETPRSPYVIDLRRDRAPLSHTDRLVRNIPILLPPSASATDGLFVTREEMLSQIHENELTSHPSLPKQAFVLSLQARADEPHAFHEHLSLPFAAPLVSGPMSDVLVSAHVHAAEDAFTALELPALEDTALPVTEDIEAFIDLEEEGEERADKHGERQRIVLHLPHGWKKAIASFVALSFVFVLPLQAMNQIERAKTDRLRIATASEAALAQLSLGTGALEDEAYTLAAADFERASAHFETAEARLNNLSLTIDAVLQTLPETQDAYETGRALVLAGSRLSKSAALFASALNEVRSTTTDTPIVKLDILTTYLERMAPLIAEADAALRVVEVEALPEEYREQVGLIVSELPALEASLQEFLTFNEVLRAMLGGDEPMRYLFIFQNNTEIRPTGGFIGSYAEMTVADGRITSLTIPGGGSYDLQGSLGTFVAAPGPLQLVNARWEFQDANWYPDFPTSAKQLLTFHDASGGPTMDGVLAVNATLVADMIDLLGPVDMPEYGRTIDGENFLFETQKIVELEYDKEVNTPKQFIADLAPKLLEKSVGADTNTFLSLLEQVGNGLSGREIQVYLTDDELMQTIDELGWSGKVKQTSGDYLMVVNTNVGGGKTDTVIDETVDLRVDIDDDGSIVNTVTITRTHRGIKNALFTGVNNVDYLRVYVPHGSELIEASGDFAPPDDALFEGSDLPLGQDETLMLITGPETIDSESGTVINEEFGKTVFGNWVQTKPGSVSTVTFRYRLPFALASASAPTSVFAELKSFMGLTELDRYTLLVQKQSGVLTRTTDIRVQVPDADHVIWTSDAALLTAEPVTLDGSSDAFFGLLFEQ